MLTWNWFQSQCHMFHIFTVVVKDSVQFSSVAQSCLTPCHHMDCSMPDFPVHHQLSELAQTHVHRVGDAIQPSPLSSPLIFASIRVFSNESVLHNRWPKYWSLSFTITLSNEYSGLISFRMNSLGLLAVQGTLKSLLQHTVQKHQFFGTQLSFGPTLTSITPVKNHSFD